LSLFQRVKFQLSVADASQFPPDEGAEVGFAGRSNAGKSSAINAITQRHGLARTSKTPGRTRLLNYFELEASKRIVDLPGYGYAAVPPADRTRWIPLLDQLRERQSFAGLILIVDARRGIRADDEALLSWVDPSTRAVHVILTKEDKLARNAAREVLAQAKQQLAARATVQLFSSQTGSGVETAQRALVGMLDGAGPKSKNPDDLGFQATGAD